MVDVALTAMDAARFPLRPSLSGALQIAAMRSY
jgi:hypothetical protein